ncbi:hypothetical protein SA2016_2597 [Sinomonas atrocyanea]|uniref:Putative Flp pilus-assembly TadG-like N-terminal domain-containing protein n=1 Tax=Sinomonas atrocyanea TaxID=37927 RepID=A0A127A383_9MICC|nr:pilus assembly protein TadG-related protein [Sinomonas atrocyanea]AMM33264.1 hypothetical protein SA2016_2597 [Sinomonas atrocyanea]GEB63640.1 hypothetical protein SAT01_10880 [Sinomonas atrocyanea]GGG58060.1 hypothetical protein GCM10007172_06110 [Sinomonas atrocyanea]
MTGWAPAVVRCRRRRRAADESGQLTVLIIGFTALCLLVATTVIAVSAVHLEFKKLLSAADGAAVAAADSFTVADTAGEGPPAAVLAPERVRAVAASYLARDGSAARFEGLSVAAATGSPDGRTATVTLTAVARIPVVSVILPDGVPIRATSSARARLLR